MSDQDGAQVTALICGHVQGVAFRLFTVQCAQAHEVRGYVRNLPDGRTVELVAEGSRTTLESFLAEVRKGPPGARVYSIDLSWSSAGETFTTFEIRH